MGDTGQEGRGKALYNVVILAFRISVFAALDPCTSKKKQEEKNG